MLTLNTFNKNISSLLYFAEVPVDEIKNNFLYNLLKNDFEDKEFGEICVDICKTEELYGKYPSPKMFYSRKEEKGKKIFIAEGEFYVDDTMPQYRDVISDLDQDTRDRICNLVWKWLIDNKRGEFVSEQFIIERLKQFRPTPKEDEPITLTEIKKLIVDHKEGNK